MRLLILALAVLQASSALAGETAWQTIAPGVSARLISSDTTNADGWTHVGLEIDMPEAVNTYWRVPGETGIPTELDLEGSVGIGGKTLLWPYPTAERQTGYLDFVYRGSTVLPMAIKLDSEDAFLSLGTVLGICSDVCVPVMADFELELGQQNAPDRVNGLRLRQALAEVPAPWPIDDPAVSAAEFDAVSGELVLTLADPTIDPASIIVACANGEAVFGVPESTSDAQVRLPLIGMTERPGPHALEVVFRTDQGAFSQTLDVDLR